MQDKFLISPKVLFQKIGEESVLLNLDGENYFGLDPIGTRIWSLLCENLGIEAIVRTLLEEYDVGEAELRQDIQQLIEQLAEARLLLPVSEQDSR